MVLAVKSKVVSKCKRVVVHNAPILTTARKTIAVPFHFVLVQAREDVRSVWLVTMPRRESVRLMILIACRMPPMEIVKTASKAIPCWMMAVATSEISIAVDSI